jgi:hypothetical protein
MPDSGQPVLHLSRALVALFSAAIHLDSSLG